MVRQNTPTGAPFQSTPSLPIKHPSLIPAPTPPNLRRLSPPSYHPLTARPSYRSLLPPGGLPARGNRPRAAPEPRRCGRALGTHRDATQAGLTRRWEKVVRLLGVMEGFGRYNQMTEHICLFKLFHVGLDLERIEA